MAPMTERSSGPGTRLPPSPLVYEINTWVWLAELADRFHPDDRSAPFTLAGVPDEIWDSIASAGFDAVWLMGVWRRSAAGVQIARDDRSMMDWFGQSLPDLRPDDIVGSPYSVRDYVVDDHLGGDHGLAVARRALADRGVALFLDFVPNHVALDHPWVRAHPSWFVGGEHTDLATGEGAFTAIGSRVIAHGRDPHFPAWTDVVQLNAFNLRLRAATAAELRRIATQCDGVRCDMAMLVMNEVFAQTWGPRVGPVPYDDFWPGVIDTVRAEHPQFVFIAEAYWGTEATLISQGFDHCYDKSFYDTLRDEPGMLAHQLGASDPAPTSAATALRFIENHDEPRAPEAFGDRDRQAAVAALTLPGARLLHHGQLSGRRRRLPVQLGRSHVEAVDVERAIFYRALLGVVRDEAFRTANWRLCDTAESAPGVLAWTRRAEQRWLIVLNTLGTEATGRIRSELFEPSPGNAETAPGVWMIDPMSGECLPVTDDGLVEVRLTPWGAMVLRVAARPAAGWVP